MASRAFATAISTETDLKKILAKKIPVEQERIKKFRKEKGSQVVGNVTIDMVSFFVPTFYIIRKKEP